jgi:hypothetical protein
MGEKAKIKQKFCGNCGSHSAYDYPTKTFCSTRFSENKNPIVETLWCCEEWSPCSQKCYCVEEALRNKNRK